LPEAVADEIQELVDLILSKTTILANKADERGDLTWAVVPKHHWFWHWGQRSRLLNPRRGNTMIDEHFVGVCKQVVASSTHGTEPHAVPTKFLEKYRWGLHILNKYGE
jgi:hypothetical protein